jgi:hypothetical protein
MSLTMISCVIISAHTHIHIISLIASGPVEASGVIASSIDYHISLINNQFRKLFQSQNNNWVASTTSLSAATSQNISQTAIR